MPVIRSARQNPYPETYEDYPTSPVIPGALYFEEARLAASPYAVGKAGPLGIYGAWYGDAFSIQLGLRMPQPSLVMPGDDPLAGVFPGTVARGQVATR